jgi:hypothetical protein
MSELPADIRIALERRVRSLLLINYAGGKTRLQDWNDFQASGTRDKNLRRLIKLVDSGALVERDRLTATSPRSFTLPSEQLNAMGGRIFIELQDIGYILNELMDRIPDQPADQST